MYSKEYYIKDIQTTVLSFNEFWEDPITDSELVKEPKKNAELIISYCKLLQTLAKNNKYESDYFKLPEDVQSIIDKIVNIVSDDRDLRHKVTYHNCRGSILDDSEEKRSREFDHHVKENGRLTFENEWMDDTNRLISECEHLIEICESEEQTADLKKYEDKILEWVHYESGSYVIRIDKINRNKKGRFTFDGAVMHYATIDSQFDKDGILFEEAEDYPFDELPFFDKYETEKELAEYLDTGKEKKMKDVHTEMHQAMDSYFDMFNRYQKKYKYRL